MKGFINAKTYIKGKGVIRTNIGIEHGKIAYIGELSDGIQPIAETGDNLLVSGFIDEHIHGAGGADAMDGDKMALSVLSETLVKEGTTSFLATTMTQSDAKIKKALKAVAGFESSNGANLLGVNLEGPFISKRYCGAQPPEYIKKPDIEYFKELQAVAQNKIKIVTLAPEEDTEYELTGYLASQGIVVSAGHSNACEQQISTAVKRGLSCVTHTYNSQTPFHHREIGIVGSALLYDGLYCEVIADTVHVCVPALKLLVKNKPEDKLILITDSIRAKGMADGVSELGGQKVFVKDGQARLADGTLAGSVLKMNEAVKTLVRNCGMNLENAIDCATYNPAKNLGIEDRYGIIKVGAQADFVLLDNDFKVLLTVVSGKQVYKL